MDPITGKLVLDGVVQIAVATLNKSAISPNEVPTFLKNIGDSLVTCINEASAAIGAGAPAAAVQPGASAKADVRPAAAPRKANASRSPAAAAGAAVAQSVSSPALSAAAVASGKKASAPEAAASTEPMAAGPVVVEEEVYKFANIPTEPVVPIGESVFDDSIVCLIDGERRKMLQRHLRSKYQMSEAEYRTHFNLPDSYPMTAPGYSKEKSIVARAQGLGTAKLYENAKSKQKATPAKVTKRQRNKAAAAASA